MAAAKRFLRRKLVRLRQFVAAATTCVAALALVACGGSSHSTSGAGHSKTPQTGFGESWSGAHRGGTLTVYDHEDFQHFDPGQSYFAIDYPVIYATQSPLYMFPPNDASHLIPLLASGPPTLSDGGHVVTVHIRHGVHFSPPVKREVTAADVAYAVERGANPNVANPYFPAYFTQIAGAAKATGGPISGISTPDRYTIVFHLISPTGGFFAGALAQPLTAPVPKEFAGPLDRKKPTQYGDAIQVATGPYMLKSDAKGKFLGIGYQPGKSATLIRNPSWSATTGDPRPAFLDQINVNIGGDPNVIGRQVLTGTHTVQNDPAAASIIKLAYFQHYAQLYAVPGAGDHYIAVNNRTGPFANVNVRKALWATLDRTAMVKAEGGQLVGQVGTHFIYPTSSGYDLAGGDLGPGVDYNNSPSGNASVAAKYMKLAGYPSGKYTGSHVVTVVGSTGDPGDKDAAIANHAIQSLGFKTNFTLVDQSVMYAKYCGNPNAKIDACPDVGWVRDWSDPQTILDPAFAGYNIAPTNNGNWGIVSWQDWPKANGGTYTSGPLTHLDTLMRAGEQANGNTRNATWAGIDKQLVANAVAIPWSFDKQGNIEGTAVHGINDLWNSGAWDYNYTSLK
jgi:peptide/nickel transport system substrate-binding protein